MNLISGSVKQSFNGGDDSLSPYGAGAPAAPASVGGFSWLQIIIWLKDAQTIGVVVNMKENMKMDGQPENGNYEQ